MVYTVHGFSTVPETLAKLLGFGFMFMGGPAFVASIIAEKLNCRINNDVIFYSIGVIAGAICCLIFALVSGDLYSGVVWIGLGSVLGGFTSVFLRFHYNRYSSHKFL